MTEACATLPSIDLSRSSSEVLDARTSGDNSLRVTLANWIYGKGSAWASIQLPLPLLLRLQAQAFRVKPQNLTLPDGRIYGCPAGSRRRVLLALPSCKFYPGAACGWTAAADSADPPRPRAGLRSVDFAPCPFCRFGCCDFRADRSASLTCSRSLSNSRNSAMRLAVMSLTVVIRR